MTKIVTVKLHGCHATTYIQDLEVTDEQLEFLEHLVYMSDRMSEDGCHPTISIDYENKGRGW
jgi:hypothetical protein